MSRGSGTTPEYAMHSESVSVQNCYRSRLAELWLKAVNSLAGRSAGHEHPFLSGIYPGHFTSAMLAWSHPKHTTSHVMIGA